MSARRCRRAALLGVGSVGTLFAINAASLIVSALLLSRIEARPRAVARDERRPRSAEALPASGREIESGRERE